MSLDLSESLQNRILSEATRLFATRGFAGTSIRELTEACGCTKPALYYYFASKEVLFREVIGNHMKSMDSLIATTVDRDGSVRQRIHDSLEEWIDYSNANPMVMRLMQRMETSVEDKAPQIDLIKMRNAHLEALAGLMQSGIDAGELSASLVPLEAAMVFVGTIHFQFELSVACGDWDRSRLHRCIDIVFDGIAQHD